MKFGLHGMVTLYSNIISDIKIAASAGYSGLEIHTEKLWRYIEAGGTSKDFKQVLDKHNIEAFAIDVIGDIEASDMVAQKKIFQEARVLSKFASEIGAGTIQLNAFEGLNALSVEENISICAKNIKQICKIGAEYGIRFQYEGAAWTPIHTLSDCLALVDEVGESNFGLVIDFWHFWASHGAEVSDIQKLNKAIIYGVHCCGGTRPVEKDEKGALIWQNERVYRGSFPGDEEAVDNKNANNYLPVQAWVDAIISTGFDGWVSGEFLNERLWEQDNLDNAILMRERLEYFFNNTSK